MTSRNPRSSHPCGASFSLRGASAPPFLTLALISLTLQAATPTILELQPRGADKSHPFTLTITGQNLPSDARIQSPLPATFTPTTTNNPKTLTFLVEPKPEAQPGVYPIRLQSDTKGISNLLLLTLGTYPEQTEEESQPYSKPNHNDTIETAEPITANPVTINGTLKGPERDVYRIQAKADERRVFEVEARRSGSAIDPTLRLLDASGKQLAISDDTPTAGLDARLDFTFPKDGNYYIEVHDARFSRQTQNFYRLKIGSYAYADSLFPLGGRRGEITEVTFSGQALKTPVKAQADLRKLDPAASLTTVTLSDSPTLPITFAVSDLPEFIAPIQGPIQVPSVINARLDKPGSKDRYTLKTTPGEKFLIEIQARNLGTSKLEGIIGIYAGTKKLDSAGDKPLAEDVFAVQGTSRTSSDPFLNFTVPPDTHEISITIEDLAERGGPNYGYRLITRREPEEFQLTIGTPYLNIPAGGTAMITVNADRRGYDGPITLTIPDLPPGIHTDGGNIAREYLDVNNSRTINRRGILTLTADPGVSLPNRDLIVIGEGKLADGTVVRKRAHGTALQVDVAGATAQGVVDRQRPVTAPWIAQDLPTAIAEPARATLELKQTNLIQMAEGGRYEFEYTWHPRPGAMPPKEVNVDIIGIKDIRIIDMKPNGKGGGTFAVTTTKATDAARYDMYISGRVQTEDGPENVISRAIPFEVTEGTPAK